MRFSIQQNTLQGKRHENQDRMGYIYTRESLLLVLCDGLGGHGNGELAAAWALQTLAHRFQHFANPLIEDPQAFLEASIIAAHGHIQKKTLSTKLNTKPRTTIVCALLQKGQLWIAHAGDSRAYLIRALKQVVRTKDHSKLQYLIDTGKIKATDDVDNHPDRNRLINCLGADMYPVVDHTGPFTLLEQDTVLLCSDGLWGTVSDEQIFAMLANPDLSQALPLLVQHASKMGGDYADDVTGVAVRWLTENIDKTAIDSSIMGKEFESTVHLTLTQEGNPILMSDEEIDATIAEINQALEKINKVQR
jgi:serine/threonine protein phosphatase PrpC